MYYLFLKIILILEKKIFFSEKIRQLYRNQNIFLKEHKKIEYNISKKFEPLYVNEFGEGCTTGIIGKEFKLNKERVIKAVKMFTENSFNN